jgi:hypothetical protein
MSGDFKQVPLNNSAEFMVRSTVGSSIQTTNIGATYPGSVDDLAIGCQFGSKGLDFMLFQVSLGQS